VDFPDRHGRWPLLAAPAAPVGTALAAAHRERLAEDDGWLYWLPLGALFWHQTEEWVKPGGFLPWFNREVMDSGEDEFPITRRDGLLINTGMGWALGLAAGLTRSPGIAACQLAMDLGNAGLHVGQAVRGRRYNPGLGTSLTMFLPLGIAGMRALWRDDARRGEVRAGAAAGAISSAALILTMRARVGKRLSPA
jgi:hypothetical protein